VTEAVHHACEPFGVTWPVDFGSKGSSTVGGNIATNAGGINVIRYGMTRQWVLGLTVVTMTGEIMQLNGALEKNNTGPDFKHLFIGSEGILGVVTEATLKLTRVDKNLDLYFFGVKDMNAVFNLLAKAREGAFDICAYETFSHNCFEASTHGLGLRSPFEKEHPQYVMIEVKGEKVDEWLEQVFEQGLVEEGVQPKSKEEYRQFWKTRESIAEFLAEKGLNHSNDVSVPIFNLKNFIQDWSTEFRAKYPNWELFVYGHIGDGNLHIHALKPANMALEDFVAQTKKVDADLFALVRKYQGSVSAEHGVGLLKKSHLGYSKSELEISLMKSIKKSLDPKWLLNPGKIIDR
jgi:FAD/FMN-containing dehydrogenase